MMTPVLLSVGSKVRWPGEASEGRQVCEVLLEPEDEPRT